MTQSGKNGLWLSGVFGLYVLATVSAMAAPAPRQSLQETLVVNTATLLEDPTMARGLRYAACPAFDAFSNMETFPAGPGALRKLGCLPFKLYDGQTAYHYIVDLLGDEKTCIAFGNHFDRLIENDVDETIRGFRIDRKFGCQRVGRYYQTHIRMRLF